MRPAYDRLLSVLREDLASAQTDHGVWKLPNGDEYYRRCLEFHTTTKMTPSAIHELGEGHVERIQNEMRRFVQRKIIDGNGSGHLLLSLLQDIEREGHRHVAEFSSEYYWFRARS